MNQTLIIATMAMLAFGIAHAFITRTLRRRNRDHGQTVWLVVIGVAVVVATYSIIAGYAAAAIVLLLFAAAGLPMIYEYVDSHTDTMMRIRMAENLHNDEK